GDRHLLGGGKPSAYMAAERGRDDRVVAAPDEQRRCAELRQAGIEAIAAKRRLEVDVARRGEERVARARGLVDAPELVDHQVADGGVDHVAVVEDRPELRGDRGAPETVGEKAEFGA